VIPELRQRHRFIWRILAFILPISFGWAFLLLPPVPIQEPLHMGTVEGLPVLEQTRETAWLIVRLRAANATTKQLEIVLKHPMPAPAAQVFWQNSFLGSLGAKGIHRFALDEALLAEPPYTLEIRDPVNKIIVQTFIIHP
jgi:hypothetical protein